MPACDLCSKKIKPGQASGFPYDQNLYCLPCMDKKLSKLPDDTVVFACVTIKDPVPKPDLKFLDTLGFEFMTYSEGQKRQKKKEFPGFQLEHMLPNSSHVSAPGRKSDPVPGADAYSEAEAIIFPIGDDQSHGTEHKFITDYERAVDTLLHENGEYATLEQKVQLMIPGWERMILQFRDSSLSRAEARRAAIELANVYLNHSEDVLGIPRDTLMRNGFLGKKADPPPDDPTQANTFTGMEQ